MRTQLAEDCTALFLMLLDVESSFWSFTCQTDFLCSTTTIFSDAAGRTTAQAQFSILFTGKSDGRLACFQLAMND